VVVLASTQTNEVSTGREMLARLAPNNPLRVRCMMVIGSLGFASCSAVTELLGMRRVVVSIAPMFF
jgi:hypothetical protein